MKVLAIVGARAGATPAAETPEEAPKGERKPVEGRPANLSAAMAIASPRIGSAMEIRTAMRERTSTAVRDPKAPDVTGTPAPMAAASHPCMSATPSRIVRMERTSRIVKVVREMSPASPIVSRENASRRLRCAMACPTVPMAPMRKTVMRANTSAITASVSRMPMCAMERKTATAERTRNSVREQKPVEREGVARARVLGIAARPRPHRMGVFATRIASLWETAATIFAMHVPPWGCAFRGRIDPSSRLWIFHNALSYARPGKMDSL